DADVLKRRCDEQAVAAKNGLTDRERLLEKRLSIPVTIASAKDVGQIIQERRVEQRTCLSAFLDDRNRVAIDLLCLLEIAGILTQVGEGDERSKIPGMLRTKRAFEERQDVANA